MRHFVKKTLGKILRPSGGRLRFHFDRITFFKVMVFLVVAVLFLRLFTLQVLSYSTYKAAADGNHEFFKKLIPKRGEIFLREHEGDDVVDSALANIGGDRLFPAVTNRDYALLYAVPTQIYEPQKVAETLAPILGVEPATIQTKLEKEGDMYEVLAKKLTDEKVEQIKALDITGLHFTEETYRFYPEKALGGQLFGFLGHVGDTIKGLYGLEGYFNDILKGKEGSLKLEQDALGSIITIGNKKVEEAVDGSSLVLTIDRVVQMVACEKLHAWVGKHGADGGSVVIMEPKTGAIIAMCSAPDYDPSDFGKADIRAYNNPAIYVPYEPGSIFKPFTAAIGLDLGVFTPTSTYEDTGSVVIGPHTIQNSDKKANGVQTMTDVLNKSLNTGTIFMARKAGWENFRKYIRAFGFGALTGIELNSEVPGTIASLDQKQEIYLATASFGQGLTVTPLQITNAYGALANGGNLMQPYIVDEIIRPDGTRIKTQPKVLRRVISERAATLLSGMLVTVVRKGHGQHAGVPGYYVAGKTGTAQVARSDGRGYETNVTIGSFAGFAPVDNPKFVMLVKIDRPRDVQWAESSAAPLFGDLAKFLLNYYEVPPDEPDEIKEKK